MTQTDQERQDGLVVTTAVFTSIAFVAVAVRSLIRFVLIRKPGADDYTILVAMLLSCGYLIEVLVGKANGIGHAMGTLSMDNMTNLIKDTLAIQVTYYTCVTFIKISVLCMYLRIAVTRTLRVLCIGTIAFHAMFFVICVSTTLAQCRPLEKMWDLTKTVDGTCINTTAFFYFTSGLNIITDIWILALPIKTLLGINRPLKEKIALICIFGVGSFSAITSIIRLHTIYTYTLATDPFQESILVNLWSVIEINTAIICASVPALKPLFTPAALAASRKSSGGVLPGSGSYSYHSEGRSAGIRTQKSVDQSFSHGLRTKKSADQSTSSEKSYQDPPFGMGPIPSSRTRITSGAPPITRRGDFLDSDSTHDILRD